jgi:hypothetical protein
MNSRTLDVISALITGTGLAAVAILFKLLDIPAPIQAGIYVAALLILFLTFLLRGRFRCLRHFLRPVAVDEFINRNYQCAIDMLLDAVASRGDGRLTMCATNLGVPVASIKDRQGYERYLDTVKDLVHRQKIVHNIVLALFDKESAARALQRVQEFADCPAYRLKVLIKAEIPRPFFNLLILRDVSAAVTFQTAEGSTALSVLARRRREVRLLSDIFDNIWAMPSTLVLKDECGIVPENLREVEKIFGLK